MRGIAFAVSIVAVGLIAAGCGKDDDAAKPKAPPAAPTPTNASSMADKAPPPEPPPGSREVVSKQVTYTAGDTTMKGFMAYPKGATSTAGVLVVHEWWGHNDYARSRATKLAQLGYTALAVDMYGDGKNTEHAKDAQKFMTEVVSNMDAGVARFEAARKLLQNDPATDPSKISAIGYCFGGAVVLHMARIGMDLDVVASFHGNLTTKAPAAKGAIKAKLFVAHGAADPFVPAEQVDAFNKEMAAAGADVKFVAYEGAKHAFTNPGATEIGKAQQLPLAYDEAADNASWSELEAMLTAAYPPAN